MYNKKKIIEQLKKDFKSRDGGLSYSFEPGRWDRNFEKQADQLMQSAPKSQMSFKPTVTTPSYFQKPSITAPKKISSTYKSNDYNYKPTPTPTPTISKRESSQQWIQHGYSYLQSKDYQKAIECYEKAAEIDPQNSMAWLAIGFVYNELENYQKTIEYYKKAIEVEPLNALAWGVLGAKYSLLGHYQEAIKYCEEAVKLDPESSVSWLILGDAHGRSGHYQKEIEYCKKAIELDPKNAGAWSRMGISYCNLGEYQKSIESYEKALDINPNYIEAWINMDLTYADLGEYEKALECDNKALEIDPQNSVAWYNMGTNYGNLKNHQKAIDSFNKAVEIDPKNSGAWYNMGIAYYKIDNYEKSIECHQKVIELEPNNQKAWDEMGSAYNSIGKYQEAIFCFENALKIDPQYTNALYNIAVAYFNSGKYQKAVNSLEKSLKIEPNDEETIELLDIIKERKTKREQAISKVQIEKIKKMLTVSKRIKFTSMRNVLQMEKEAFDEKVFDWADEFGFIVDGDFLVINQETISDFIDELDRQSTSLEDVEDDKIIGKKEIRKKGGILAFISYSIRDSELFNIKDIAETISKYEFLKDVLYCEEDTRDNFIKYMNKYVGKCDIMILFCSQNALNSEFVEDEWMAARAMKKPIIPVFTDVEHIPPLLRARIGVEYSTSDLQKNIDDIYNLILKKIRVL